MKDYRNWLTMQDIDQRTRQPKGTAFSAFKRMLPTLKEGTDFTVLDPYPDEGIGADLDKAGRIYSSSVHPVLLSPVSADRVTQQIGGMDALKL